MEGNSLGEIINIFNTGASDVIVVSSKNDEILIPAVKDVVKKIDYENNKLFIDPLEGLF